MSSSNDHPSSSLHNRDHDVRETQPLLPVVHETQPLLSVNVQNSTTENKNEKKKNVMIQVPATNPPPPTLELKKVVAESASQQNQKQQEELGKVFMMKKGQNNNSIRESRRAAADDKNNNGQNGIFGMLSPHWFPSRWEDDDADDSNDDTDDTNIADLALAASASEDPEDASIFKKNHHHHHRWHTHRRRARRRGRSWKRRLFLFLTEPNTSIASAVFFVILVVAISLMNLVMILQTIPQFQFTPTDCRSCGGTISYLFDDDDSIIIMNPKILETYHIDCICPPSPHEWTHKFLDRTVYFFTVEWTLRVLCYEPSATELLALHVPDNAEDDGATSFFLWWEYYWTAFCQWFAFLTSTSTILDALAIFPYYVENVVQTNGLMSLRLLRLFRVFQLVRLGQYNETFMALSTVLFQSVVYLKLLLGVLFFGAAFFGSMMYWIEKGDWKYHPPSQSYQFVRTNVAGEEEISPFSSIPASFWWFFVTATTVGYGDVVPVTTGGKLVATLAMLTGVLVIAFPVSVFSDLWSKELRKIGALAMLDDDDDDDDNDGEGDDTQGEEEEQQLQQNGGGNNEFDNGTKNRGDSNDTIRTSTGSSQQQQYQQQQQQGEQRPLLLESPSLDTTNLLASYDSLLSSSSLPQQQQQQQPTIYEGGATARIATISEEASSTFDNSLQRQQQPDQQFSSTYPSGGAWGQVASVGDRRHVTIVDSTGETTTPQPQGISRRTPTQQQQRRTPTPKPTRRSQTPTRGGGGRATNSSTSSGGGGGGGMNRLSFVREDSDPSPQVGGVDVPGGIDSNHYIVMHRDDLAEILASLQSIHENQRVIRGVLKKYR